MLKACRQRAAALAGLLLGSLASRLGWLADPTQGSGIEPSAWKVQPRAVGPARRKSGPRPVLWSMKIAEPWGL
jgi:hypothetical protein